MSKTINDPNSPHSVAAEFGVLGSMLIEEEIAGEIIQLLNKSCFLVPANQVIFEVMIHLYDNNKPLDVIVLQEELRSRGLLDQIGGSEYLFSLVEGVPSAGNVEHYAHVVRDKSILRQLMAAADEIGTLTRSGNVDTDDLLDRAEQLIYEVTQKKAVNEPEHIYNLLLNIFADIENSNHEPGLSSGFPDLDNLLSGLKGSTLNILAARPSMGKTSFALNIADNVGVRQSEGVLIFSVEMSKDQLARNMVCARARISPHKLSYGVDEKEYKILTTDASVFAQAPIYIDDTPAISIREIQAKARRFKNKKDIKLIIIDYLQLLEGPKDKKENRQQEISFISRKLKEVARELDVPIIALSQLNRAVDARDDHRPRMSDLRESGALEQDADSILFLYRDEYYNKETTEPGISEVIVAKNRTGPTGSVKLRFIKEYMKFMGISYQKPT
ncbi:replicative DNA helicase [Candidatus Uabimicrobium sp. HlEnr_7]|uniref:replicative DNA helicase n=1 Tax=Candidatus Uabimicrobium helgolandensis TaxID=3095367 RepID=UPI0035560ABD